MAGERLSHQSGHAIIDAPMEKKRLLHGELLRSRKHYPLSPVHRF